jgi:hypothetical protein
MHTASPARTCLAALASATALTPVAVADPAPPRDGMLGEG